MLQVRKLVLAVAVATAFSSSLSHALGLGDLSVKSSLNQPLEAEISLLEVRDLTSVEIKTQLASPEEFSKAGVDRQFFLTGLKFTPVLNANGKSVIRVTSANPVKEPYLNFLVEILWPNGRLLREYTLLLDPPLYNPQQIVYAPQPATIVSSSRPAASVQQTARSPQQTTAVTSQPVRQASNAMQGTEYRVQKNDTLWEIAARVGGNAAVHQTMLAIQDLNPNAFLDGNINRMKSGQVLRLPTEQEIGVRSRAEAIAQVAQQNTNWKTERVAQTGAERQLDATHRNEAGVAPAAVEKADNLRLVADAPGQAEQAADQGSAANVKAVQDQLAITKERLDSTALENADLKGRVEDLNSQLEKLQRLIELKDNQLAQLQNAVDTTDTTLAPVETAAVTVADVVEPAIEAVVDTAVVEPTIETVADAAIVEPAAVEPVVEQEQLEPVVPEQVEVEPEPVVEPVIQPQTEVSVPVAEPVLEEESLLDQVMNDPMLLAAGGGAAVLALLLLLMTISRRNARKEAEFYDAQLNNMQDNEGLQSAVAGEAIDTDFLSNNDLEKADASTEAPFAEEFDFEAQVTESQFKQHAVDSLAEADSYISFGRFNQAADVLSKAVDQEPQRIDLRLKLVEVYADLEDRDGFSRQIQDITEIGGATAELAQVKARYPQMFDAEQVDNLDLNNDFDDFNLDDLTLDLPTESAVKEREISAELDDLSALLAETESDLKTADGEFNLDVDLDLGVEDSLVTLDSDAPALTETAVRTNLDDFNFDLDTDVVESKPTLAEQNDFAELSLADLELDSPALQQEQAVADFSLDDFNFEADAQIDSDFGAQLDEVNAELDNLTASLNDDVLELKSTAESVVNPMLSEVVEPLAEDNDPVMDFADLQDLDGLDDDFGILAGTDETATKLDLARAYVDMGDAEGARDILDEVIAEGTSAQQDEARELIAQLG